MEINQISQLLKLIGTGGTQAATGVGSESSCDGLDSIFPSTNSNNVLSKGIM